MKIGLAFPELGKHDIGHFVGILKNTNHTIDLIVFPEAFETIPAEDGAKPEEVRQSKQVESLFRKYLRISKGFNVSIVLGVSMDYGNVSLNGGGNDQYCLFVNPSGKRVLYHKHSTSRSNAFFDANWSVEGNFPVVKVNGKKVGISICHDFYISLIARVLKAKGADIWVNISYQNVRPHIWKSVLQTGATENGVIAVCALHRNSSSEKGGGRPQKQPYAFSETGEILLKDLATHKTILDIPDESRSGRIFYFDVYDYETCPREKIKKSQLPDKATTVSIRMDGEGNVKAEGAGTHYSIEEMAIEEFVYSPEKIWEICLADRCRIPLFVVWTRSDGEWDKYRPKVERIINGRVIEFSTLFLFLDKKKSDILLAAYRSSNYKDVRILYPKGFLLNIDRRYLKGLESTYKISLNDCRGENDEIYFERVLSYFGRIRTPKDLEKEFFQVLGVTGVAPTIGQGQRRQRGRAPMEICEANLGSRAKPGIPPSPLIFWTEL